MTVSTHRYRAYRAALAAYHTARDDPDSAYTSSHFHTLARLATAIAEAGWLPYPDGWRLVAAGHRRKAERIR